MKNILKLTMVLLLLSSCIVEYKGNFVIVNNSDFDLDSVSIQPDSKEHFINITQGTRSSFTTHMDKVQTDGSYLIFYKNAKTNDLVEFNFGYFTNGYQVEDRITITVENDTIITNGDL